MVKWYRKWLSLLLKVATLAQAMAYSPYANQARLYSEHGHLFIVGGEHSNITLKTMGKGFVNINDQDLLHITNMARRSADFVERFQTSILPQLQGSSSSTNPAILARLRRIETSLADANSTGSDLSRAARRKLRLLNNRVLNLARIIRALRRILATDECESNPCQHGGTCHDLFNGFHCHCTGNWQGQMCEEDVNECEIYAGTDFACQNGATCRNLKGSFLCTCPPGWYGLQCNTRTYDCTAQASKDLCGHGICVNVGGTGQGFTCICDEGWTNKPGEATCTVDKNECENPQRPCSHDPYVECQNTPGSFTCGQCPHGYSGNGYQCADIDECQINNGGCSTSPMVDCINTRGSRRCGACPPGYIGDGTSCNRVGRCQVNNGGCHQLAVCQDNLALSYVECRCPPGYTGLGVGPNGCVPGTVNSSACAGSPCANGGTCIPTDGGRYMCKCLPAFSGPNCSEGVDPCSSAPCKNGGTCERIFLGMRTEYFRCICPPGYSGRTCATSHEGCIARYHGRGGAVVWPSTNETLLSFRPVVCSWTIETYRNKVINLTFTDFYLRGPRQGSRCLSNYIEVYDGGSSSFPQIGQFCGQDIPKPILSTHPSLYVTARFLPYSRPHFAFNWTIADPKCGGEINATTHGSFASPGSPGPYPKSAHCIWKLSTDFGHRIQLTFFSLDIETHANCSFDYLEIHDGDSEVSPLLSKLCNSTLPAPIVSSGNQVTVIFHSDGKGFQIAYLSREGIPGCGGVYTQSHGTITPPTPPSSSQYLEGLLCEWRIQAPMGEKIHIEVESFSIEASDGCIYDSLEIFDGPSKDSGLIGRWCGQVSVPPATSTSNALLVVFHSDYSENEGGFVVKYSTVCGGTWSDSNGIIKSPYYPHHYPEDRICTFMIQRPIGSAIKLNFIDFDLEDSEECTFDKLKIFDGNTENSPLVGEYCGSKKPGQIISTHNYLLLVLSTDSTMHGRGFQANFTSVDVQCGGILTEKTGSISSPHFPDEYPHGQDCMWVISTAPGTMIQLSWISFNIEKSYRCYRDWVKIFDNNTVQSYAGQLGSAYCGNTLPPTMTSSSNIMSIIFHTNRVNSAPGFSASYYTLDAKNVCSANFFTSMGEIKSPNFPNGYPENIDCSWTITVPDGQQIELTPNTFDIEREVKCHHDYLEVRNGGHNNSPLIQKYCGRSFNRSIISTTNQLYLRFVSDQNVVGPGFYLTWDGALTGCGGTLTSSDGAIMSPNYPQPYGRSGECIWKIVVAHGSAIALTIQDLELEEHGVCAFDFLEIFDGDTRNSPKLAKLCSQDHPLMINSKGNKMLIRFRSDMSRQGRGFHLKYATVCNVTLTGYRGVIETPGFPEGERISARECLWNISAPAGNKVNLTFSHFDINLFYDQNCSDSFVEVFDGNNSPNDLIGKYCNKNRPDTVISSNVNNVFIHYKQTSAPRNTLMYFLGKNIFRLEWVVSGCGGVYKGQRHGEITSPNYPKAYPHGITCEWYISVLPGNSVKLTIDDLQIEYSEGCPYDALEVYGGLDGTSPNLAILCNKLSAKTPSVLTTSGNSIFIRFRSDSSNNNKGFHAIYDLVPSDCGGEFTSPSGSFHSHNYPQNYEPHDDCSFVIKVDETHRVNLTFTDFDIDSIDKNCTNGYVKVYDGDSPTSPLLKTLCGNKIPEPILSTQNTMYVRHKTSGYAVAKGFYASYKPACGAILSTDSQGSINFSEMNTTIAVDFDTECTWIIRSELPSSKMRMQFAFLEIPLSPFFFSHSSENDTNIKAGINILTGEGTDAPFFGHYAGTRVPTPFIVPSSVVTVLFKRPADFHPSRFILDYSVLDTACGGMLIGESGTIVSPSYPDPYPNNIECIWTLVVAPGNSMSFEFKQFNLQQSASCNDDYVEIRLSGESGPLIGVFCGADIPNRIDANATLWIKFRSGLEGSASGFEAQFALATHSDLTGFIGEVGSPLYPLPYFKESTYTWRITVKPRHVIRFAFTDFYLESMTSDDSYDDSCYNSLQVYDGYDDTAPLLNSLCGVSAPDPFSSGSNVVFLELKQIYSNLHSHFLLNWMQMEKLPPPAPVATADANCSTYVELKRGANGSYPFTSPGFPHGYPNNAHCEWIFQAPAGDRVKITFNSITLEEDPHCYADSITLFNGLVGGDDHQWTQTESFCSENATKAYYGSRLVKVLFKTDSSINKTGFSGKAWSICGGEINEPNGVLAEDSYTSCQWNITVKRGRRIKVSFDKFLVRGSPPCTINYLIMRDGGRPDSPLLGQGKYCGDTIPQIPETTSNRLYIDYRSGLTEGMIMKFEEKSAACGGTVMLSHNWKSSIITSPNYPQVPPPRTECIWQVFAPSGESVHFEVTQRFDMTWSKGCELEYLELRDGSTENAPFIGRYCSQPPNFVSTEGNALFIKYFTDTEIPKDGFNATVSINRCGGTIYTSGQNGTIYSPGYPASYEGNLNCTWKLVAPEWAIFTLNFTIQLGGSMSWARACNTSIADSLTVAENMVDGMQLEGPESITMCGNRELSFESETSQVLLNFISRRQPTHRGKRFFILNYEDKRRKCGGEINLPSGIIKSPNYPMSYLGRVYCAWRITVPEGRRVSFRILDLDLEPGTNRTRPHVVTFYNGHMYIRITYLTGTLSQPKVIESSGNKMMVTYTSAYRTNHRGFIGNYTSLEPALCGGSINTDRVLKGNSIELDASLLYWNSSYNCEWKFSKADRSRGTITFFFEGSLKTALTPLYHECFFISSRISFLDDKSVTIGSFCDTTKPNEPFVLSKPNDMTIVQSYKSVWSRERRNASFHLSWTTSDCGGVFTVSSPLTINSPGDTYPPNLDCVWSVSVAEGSTIKIKFLKFDIGSDCKDDYLKIHNGYGPRSPVMSNRCGSIVPADVISQSSKVWIHFHSGSVAKQKKGFSLEVSQEDSGCSGIFSSKTGIIQSPNYPSNYKNNIECDWEIHSTIGFHIGLTFTGRFFIESSPQCDKDYVEVYDYVDDQWKLLAKLCGRELPKPFNSTSNKMRVLFRTNDKITGDGFQAMFNWNCGGEIDVSGPGHIYSPGWPSNYASNIDCNYTLKAPGKTITLTIQDFSLESGSPNGCIFDKVQFFTRNYKYHNLKSNGIYCGQTFPPVQRSLGKLGIHFVADEWVSLKGFHMTYDITSCGGEITEETVISSAGVSVIQEDLTRCTWNITAPSDRIVNLKLSELSLTRSPSCRFEHFDIYDTSNTSSNGTLLGRICGKIRATPVFFKSTGNRMKINLVTYSYSRPRPFSAIISFVYGPAQGCGGQRFITPNSMLEIVNPDIDHDGQYDDNMDCSWTISTTLGSTILLSFVKMDFKPCIGNFTNATCCDALEVFDGNSPNSQLIGKYCEHNQAQLRSISSSGSYLTLRFVSDSTGHGTGFKVKLSDQPSLCGPPILNVTKTPQFLTSPNFPQNYPINVHCYWVLSSTDYMRIDIHFKLLDIENSTNCTADRLEISDGGMAFWRVSSASAQVQNVFAGSLHPYLPLSEYPTGISRFCGKGIPLDYYTFSDRAVIRFISDSHFTSKGFQIQYSYAGCSRNYTSPQGRILISRQKKDCEIFVTSPVNTTISLYFNKILLFKNTRENKCINKLEVIEKDNKTEVCGYWTPPPIFSKSNSLKLKLTASGDMSSTVDLTYTSTSAGPGCGGKLHNYYGVFTSPFYPGNFRNFSHCCWEITVPHPNVPKIEFSDFDIGLRSTCDSNYVEIYDVNSDTGDWILRTTYCGEDKPAVFFGTGTTVVVCYKTSIHNSGIGFSGTFTAYSNSVTGPALLSPANT